MNKTSDCLANHKDWFDLKTEVMQKYSKGLACHMFHITNKDTKSHKKDMGGRTTTCS